MGLGQDKWSVVLLLFLYTLQGIPLGLSSTMDLYLQERSVSFEKQGIFGFSTLPFSLKLLWAPLVDSIYFRSIGRRKSWLIPVQLLIGFLLLFTSSYLPVLLKDNSDEEPAIYKLTALFFIFYFLAATQDIAVDGWAVTMLSEKNAGYASTCNSVGQTFGFLLGYTIFLWLDITLDKYIFFFGLFFIVSTFVVQVFVSEVPQKNNEAILSITETYRACYKILKLKEVLHLNVFFFCYKAVFAAFDMLSMRIILQKGLSKESVANFSLASTIFTLFFSGLISSYTTTKPLSVLYSIFLPRLVLNCCLTGLVFVYSNTNVANMVLLVLTIANATIQNAAFVSFMSYYAKISNENIGGTSMTLFNTFNNLSGLVPQQASLFLVNKVSFEGIDGYYVLCLLSCILGLCWFSVYGSNIFELNKVNLNKL